MHTSDSLDELDLSIPNMHTAEDEERAASVIRGLPGVDTVRLVPRGAWIAYRAATITRQQICSALADAGFRASTFQDSASGAEGSSNV